MLSPTLLTAETSAVLLVDYQEHVLRDTRSHNRELIEFNGRALARAARDFKVPIILSTIGVQMRGDHPTLPSIRQEIPDVPEYDRTTMNAWDDEGVREAVAKTGRRRLIFAGLTTEVCLMYPVLHAQSEGFETYFVVDAVGGGTMTAHETAVQRMIQAGSQPLTLHSLWTEWVRDWQSSPHDEAFFRLQEWYEPGITSIRERLAETPALVTVA